jgi:hypothetical protein
MAGGTYMLGEERLDTVGTEPAPVLCVPKTSSVLVE